MFASAFQANAFQNNAFQVYVAPTPTNVGGDGWTREEWLRAQRLDKKIAERQRKLEQAIKDANASRKQSIRDLVSPVAKVKQSKVQSKQEVKADIPLAETEDLQRSISYLERQRDNILAAVAYRNQQKLIQEQLMYMEAKRLEELDDEESVLILLHQTLTHSTSQLTSIYTLEGMKLALGDLNTAGILTLLPNKPSPMHLH